MTPEELAQHIEFIGSVYNAYGNQIRYIKNRIRPCSILPNTITNGEYISPCIAPPRGNYLSEGINSLKIMKDCDCGVPVGVCISAQMDLSLNYDCIDPNDRGYYKEGDYIMVETGILTGSNYYDSSTKTYHDINFSTITDSDYTWLTLGYYKIDSVEYKKMQKELNIRAFDYINYIGDSKFLTSIPGPITATQAMLDAAPYILSRVDKSTFDILESITLTQSDLDILSEYTAREALGFIAGLNGMFALCELENIVIRNGWAESIDIFNLPSSTILSHGNDLTIHRRLTNYRFDFDTQNIDLTRTDKSTVLVRDIIMGCEDYRSRGFYSMTLGSYSDDSKTQYYIFNPLIGQGTHGGNYLYNVNGIFTDTGSIKNIYNKIMQPLPLLIFSLTGPGGRVYSNGLIQGRYSTGILTTNGNPMWDIGNTIMFIDPADNRVHRIMISKITMDLSSGFSQVIESNPMPTSF